MLNYNRTIMMGRLTRDPELQTLPSGTESMTTAVAVNHTWKDKQSGEKREEVCFIDLQAFGRTAEVITEYFRQWETAEGEKRSKHDLLVDGFEFVGGRSESQILSNVNSTQTKSNSELEAEGEIPF